MILYYAAKEQKGSYNWHEYERNIFATCKVQRTNKGKVKNRFSREEAGVCGMYTRTNRFPNSYITIVTKSNKIY